MNDSQPSGIKLRLAAYRGLIVIAFLALVGQLWRLQMVRGEYYREAADVNRFRLESGSGPRGVIYDRRGYLLARNMPQITVSIIPAYLPEDKAERRDLLFRLSELVAMPLTSPPPSRTALGVVQPEIEPNPEPDPGILDILAEAEQAPYRPALLKAGIPREVGLILEEEHLDWPGVLVHTEPVREYLYGPLTAHLLGYVGPIPEHEAEAYEAKGYDPNRHQVGLTGVEFTFEDELSGQDGQKLVEVDVAGREIRTVGKPRVATPGHNLRLTLDLDLQQATEEILVRHLQGLYRKQGVVVVLNPQTGEILAMVSLPNYDNNEFTGGISQQTLQELREDPNRPLVNHAISGMFPPGSTYKIMVAAAALEEGVITTDTRLHCDGILWLPNRFYPEDPSLAQPFYCWIHHDYHGKHGTLGVISALGRSCDIFFYQVGGGYRDRFEGLGEEQLGYYAELFGMGARTGLDLPGEAPGLVPTIKWKRVNYSESWVTGDTYNMSIGQGFVLATPLQVVNATAAIANGGILYRPQVVREVLDAEGDVIQPFAPDVIRSLPISAENLGIVRQGMRAAVAGSGATAWAIDVPGAAVAGKTGTAEFFIDRNKDGVPDRDREGNLPTHAWFTAFAPYKDPEIALVVFVFGGGEGSTTAVPIANDILNYYFGQEGGGVQP
ncbi:MAG: penicillin-binding protein 2 [Anaerolineae bacterium]